MNPKLLSVLIHLIFTICVFAEPSPGVKILEDLTTAGKSIGGSPAKILSVDLIGEQLVGDLYEYKLKVIFNRGSLDKGDGFLVLLKAKNYGEAYKKLTPHLSKDQRDTLGAIFISGISGLPFSPLRIAYQYSLTSGKSVSSGIRRNKGKKTIVEELSFTLPPGRHLLKLISKGDLEQNLINNVLTFKEIVETLKNVITGNLGGLAYDVLKSATIRSKTQFIGRYNIEVLVNVPQTVGLSEFDALKEASRRSLKHEFRNTSECEDSQTTKIVKQSPKAGVKIKKGSKLLLYRCTKEPNSPFFITGVEFSPIIYRNEPGITTRISWTGYAEFPLKFVWEPASSHVYVSGHTYGTVRKDILDRTVPLVLSDSFGCFGFYPPDEVFNYQLYLTDSRGVKSNVIGTTITCKQNRAG